jgi:hypothetical protein
MRDRTQQRLPEPRMYMRGFFLWGFVVFGADRVAGRSFAGKPSLGHVRRHADDALGMR